ncbi:hypothetical protein M422DRAFT_270433 [Sphaerobolus stellatus SS14]|uniref:Uncharacterized protein n=1 Tax=Sphaerobolus stellatus (strain SS14) TaxID=990650 RepID=A0A0C9USG3_SPHS4|nr:hypothetical protein M422DRAFT_270433 [Sphaerobolus stellatus SS14]
MKSIKIDPLALLNIYPSIGVAIGNANVQVTSVITAIIVSHLFLDLREAAHHSQQFYESAPVITGTVGQRLHFDQNEHTHAMPFDANIPTENGMRGTHIIGRNRNLIGNDDFGVDLRHFDDDEDEQNDLTSTDEHSVLASVGTGVELRTLRNTYQINGYSEHTLQA